jgi:hypothetical protein
MSSEIQAELERIVGGEGVRVSPVPTKEEANRRVQLETANAVYEVPENRLLILLKKLPDGIGIEALRQAVEEELPATRPDEGP